VPLSLRGRGLRSHTRRRLASHATRANRHDVPTLLLADHNDEVRDVLRLHAENRGLEVVGEAGDGREAVELAEHLDPDAIILDQEMPSIPGLAAVRVLRRRAPRTMVVMYSSDPSIMRSALAAGASAYFSKGHSPREVVMSVLTLLEGSRAGPGSPP
jgi:DNA-binding NarL/FixJ family response regulator